MKYEIMNKNKDNHAKNDTRTNHLVEKPQWRFEEIALSQETIEQIDQMIAYIHHREKLLHEWQFNRFLKAGNGLGINFFGSPGTGKSITTEAIAHKLGMNIIKVNYGELESEFMGQTSKNLSAIFKNAEETHSVLFFDEADAILSRRLSNMSQAADHSVNMTKSVLLTLLDKYNGIIVFATNLFDNYDEAFLRRILFHVEFPLPDISMRTNLWKFHLSQNVPKSLTYERMAELSEGLSGGDIRNIVIKLGLGLLVGNIHEIDENMTKGAIEKYHMTKKQNKKIRIGETSLTEISTTQSQQ